MSNSKKGKPVAPPKKPADINGHNSPSFFNFIFRNKQNRYLLLTGLGIGVLYYIVLKVLYPTPFLPLIDSYQYIHDAHDNVRVSYRPLGYSGFISFFHNLSHSANTLIFWQYFANVIANLFLFFSFTFFFKLNKTLKIILFIFLTAYPLYPLYSNYILTESFFHGFVVLWFGLLLWLIYRPSWYVFVLQAVLLIFLFKLRYNALFFPLFIGTALLLSRQHIAVKALYFIISVLSIYLIIQRTEDATYQATGYRVFSAFGGWMLANNTMYVLQHINPDTSVFTAPESKDICLEAKKYFSKNRVRRDTVDAVFMWNDSGPLKKYLRKYLMQRRLKEYFPGWTVMGTVYSNFAKEILTKYPLEYLHYFSLPNAKAYWNPLKEAYDIHYLKSDSIGHDARLYYEGLPKKDVVAHTWIIGGIVTFSSILFQVANGSFLLLLVLYFAGRYYKRSPRFFNVALIFYTAYYLFNFLFSVIAAPITLRYNISIITLCVTFIIFLVQAIFMPVKNTSGND